MIYFILFKSDLCVAWRDKTDWVNAWLFFVVIVCLFPLTIGPDAPLLRAVAPGVIWLVALFAMLLALQNFLRPAYQEGTIDSLLLSPYPLSMLLLAKLAAHWCTSALPLILTVPALAILLHLNADAIGVAVVVLVLGTLIFMLVGGIGHALTITLEHANFLLALLVFPLYVPVLIFGASAINRAAQGLPVLGILLMLLSFFILALTLAPVAMSFSLRLGEAGC